MTEPKTTPAVSTAACPFCLAAVPAAAKVCASCGADRRRPGARWHGYRESRRTDIVIAAFTVMVLSWLIAFVVLAVFARPSSSPTRTSVSCPVSDPDWPAC